MAYTTIQIEQEVKVEQDFDIIVRDQNSYELEVTEVEVDGDEVQVTVEYEPDVENWEFTIRTDDGDDLNVRTIDTSDCYGNQCVEVTVDFTPSDWITDVEVRMLGQEITFQHDRQGCGDEHPIIEINSFELSKHLKPEDVAIVHANGDKVEGVTMEWVDDDAGWLSVDLSGVATNNSNDSAIDMDHLKTLRMLAGALESSLGDAFSPEYAAKLEAATLWADKLLDNTAEAEPDNTAEAEPDEESANTLNTQFPEPHVIHAHLDGTHKPGWSDMLGILQDGSTPREEGDATASSELPQADTPQTETVPVQFSVLSVGETVRLRHDSDVLSNLRGQFGTLLSGPRYRNAVLMYEVRFGDHDVFVPRYALVTASLTT